MFALEIINALNDPDNPAKPKGLNAKLKVAVVGEDEPVSTQDELDEPTTAYEREYGTPKQRAEAFAAGLIPVTPTRADLELQEKQASEALDRREERNISHHSGRYRGRFRY